MTNKFRKIDSEQRVVEAGILTPIFEGAARLLRRGISRELVERELLSGAGTEARTLITDLLERSVKGDYGATKALREMIKLKNGNIPGGELRYSPDLIQNPANVYGKGIFKWGQFGKWNQDIANKLAGFNRAEFEAIMNTPVSCRTAAGGLEDVSFSRLLSDPARLELVENRPALKAATDQLLAYSKKYTNAKVYRKILWSLETTGLLYAVSKVRDKLNKPGGGKSPFDGMPGTPEDPESIPNAPFTNDGESDPFDDYAPAVAPEGTYIPKNTGARIPYPAIENGLVGAHTKSEPSIYDPKINPLMRIPALPMDERYSSNKFRRIASNDRRN